MQRLSAKAEIEKNSLYSPCVTGNLGAKIGSHQSASSALESPMLRILARFRVSGTLGNRKSLGGYAFLVSLRNRVAFQFGTITQ
jgi:hypothetical protein